jgi:hypothetical protein
MAIGHFPAVVALARRPNLIGRSLIHASTPQVCRGAEASVCGKYGSLLLFNNFGSLNVF